MIYISIILDILSEDNMKSRVAMLSLAFGASLFAYALAQEQSTPGKEDLAKSELLTNENLSNPEEKGVKPQNHVTMWCNTTNGGHTIQITASNNSANNISCSSTCYYKLGGLNGNLYCSGTVPARANHVVFCSRYSSNTTFVVTNVGSNNCP